MKLSFSGTPEIQYHLVKALDDFGKAPVSWGGGSNTAAYSERIAAGTAAIEAALIDPEFENFLKNNQNFEKPAPSFELIPVDTFFKRKSVREAFESCTRSPNSTEARNNFLRILEQRFQQRFKGSDRYQEISKLYAGLLAYLHANLQSRY